MNTFTYNNNDFIVYDYHGSIIFTEKLNTTDDILQLYEFVEDQECFTNDNSDRFYSFFHKLLWNKRNREPIRDMTVYKTKIPIGQIQDLFV